MLTKWVIRENDEISLTQLTNRNSLTAPDGTILYRKIQQYLDDDYLAYRDRWERLFGIEIISLSYDFTCDYYIENWDTNGPYVNSVHYGIPFTQGDQLLIGKITKDYWYGNGLFHVVGPDGPDDKKLFRGMSSSSRFSCGTVIYPGWNYRILITEGQYAGQLFEMANYTNRAVRLGTPSAVNLTIRQLDI